MKSRAASHKSRVQCDNQPGHFFSLFASSGLSRWSLFPRFDPVNKPGDHAWMWLPPPPVKTSRSLSDLCRRAEEGAHRLWFLLSPTNLRLSRSPFPFIPSSPRLSADTATPLNWSLDFNHPHTRTPLPKFLQANGHEKFTSNSSPCAVELFVVRL